MWRILTLVAILVVSATAAGATTIGAWQSCRAEPGPRLTACRPLVGRIDPQGRELWLRAPVSADRDGTATPVLQILGVTSSEVWFNGVRIGANGQPGPSAAAERPGRYETSFPLPESLWRPQGNELVLRLSAFHAGVRFVQPVGGIWIGDSAGEMRLPFLALTLIVAGALLAASFGFGAIFAIRRTGSSLTLAALASVAAVQALIENIRYLEKYAYPLHVWRVGAIWLAAAAFAVLLVIYASARFAPRRRNQLLTASLVLVAASYAAPGFDEKAGLALVTGVLLAGVAVLLGVRRHLSGARPVLAYLAGFLAVVLLAPGLLLDLSFFILAAGLLLPLLVADVLRLGRDDRDREAALTRAASRPDRLTVATPKGVELTPLGDIIAILGADDYAELRLAGARSLLHSARLERLETQLPSSFVRIHRSVIANLGHVERLERDGARWRLHMSEGPPLPVSRSRLPSVREAIDQSAIPLRARA
jgi:LytTr DNA-binding domain